MAKRALVAFAESALRERLHVLGWRVVAWTGSRSCPFCPARALHVPLLRPKLKIEKLRILPIF